MKRKLPPSVSTQAVPADSVASVGPRQRSRPADEASALRHVLKLVMPAPLPVAVLWGHQERLYYNAAFAALEDGAAVAFGAVLPKSGKIRACFDAPEQTAEMDGRNVCFPYGHVCWVPDDNAYPCRILMLGDDVLAGAQPLAEQDDLHADGSQKLLWRCLPDGEPVWMNARAKAFTGRPKPAGWQEVLDGDDPARLTHAIETAAETRSGFHIVLRLRAGAQGRWHRFGFRPLYDVSGGLSAWVASAIDIDAWYASWEAARTDRVSELDEGDLLWRMAPDDQLVQLLEPEGLPSWGPGLEDCPVRWDEWCAVFEPEYRAAALAVPERVVQGEVVRMVLPLLEQGPQSKAVLIHAFPKMLEHDGTMGIGGIMRPVAMPHIQRVYWVALSGAQEDGYENQRVALLRDQIRVLPFTDAETFVALYDRLEPGAVVFGAPEQHAALFRLLAQVELTARNIPWLVVNARSYPLEVIVNLMREGALDVLSDTTGPRIMTDAIKQAVARVVHDGVLQQADNASVHHRMAQLSKRERQVLDGLIAGGTNKSIAMDLGISPRTVEAHRAHLMDRLGARNLADLVRSAVRAGLVSGA